METYPKRRLATVILAVLCLALGMLVASAAARPHPASASACSINNDPSAPAEAELANSRAATATTASFSPPAGADVVVEVSVQYDSNTTTGPAVTVKDSGNVAYAAGPSAYDGGASGTYIFSHYYASAPGPVTVKATRSKTGAAMFDVKTRVLTGAAPSQAGAASMSAHAQSGTSFTHSITPTNSGSDVEASVSVAHNAALTASGLTTDSSWGDVNDGSATAGGHVKPGGTSPVTAGWTGPSSAFWSLAALEVLPSNGCGQAPPAVTTAAASGTGSATATLNGTVNPEGGATTYQFDYGPTTAYGTSVPVPAASAGSGTADVPVSQDVTGLTASTGYHYRIEATNAGGTTYGADQQFTTTAPGGLLTWSPPDCGGADGLTCTTINVPSTGPFNPSLAANVDYKLVMPSVPMTGGTLAISGGHNVQVIGGEIDLVTPCSDSGSFCPTQANGALYIHKQTAGEVYVEGLLIENPAKAADTASSCPGGGQSCSISDGIIVNEEGTTTPSRIVLQNDRMDGISGCSGGPDHADALQPYDASTSEIDIDHLTATTNCQGLTLDPDLGYTAYGNLPSYNVQNANVDILRNPYSGLGNRYGLWLTGGPTGCAQGSISLDNVWESEPDGTLNTNSVWPGTAADGGPSGCQSSWNASTGQLSFPNSPQITGVVNEGTPPGGDYVPDGVAGTGYVSPGYK